MKKIILLSMILLVFIAGTQAQTNQTQSANAYLMHYIDALNLHDYQSAYAMLDNPTQTYTNFVNGYAQTERIVPYFGFTGAAAGSTYVTTVLLGYQTDGTVESYYGYYQLTSGWNYSPVRNNGGLILLGGHFKLIKDGDALHNSTIEEILSGAWDENLAVPKELETISEMNDEAARTLLSYYDLINQGEYGTAYTRWLSPAQGLSLDYRLPYQRFVTGYGDTTYVMVYTAQIQAIPQNQYRTYLYAYLPAILIGEHTDGTFVTYKGCYALGYLNAGLGIVNGKFTLLQEDVPSADTIFPVMNSLNCANLGMGI